MRNFAPFTNRIFKTAILFFLLNFISYAQNDIKVEILGGANVGDGDNVAITEGNALTFRITNNRNDCDKVKIEDINISNTTDFSISTDKIPKNVDNEDCKGKTKHIDFVVTNISGNCGATTGIEISIKKNPDFIFAFSISGSPEINVLGGSPSADVLNNATATSASNGTYYGVVDEGTSITRYFIIANTGSCPLDITAISSSLSDFIVPTSPAPYVLLPNYSPSFLSSTVSAGSYVILPITFLAPNGGSGTLTSTISISNTANTTFTFDVSAEMFDFNIPGPGGITADFRLWLKSTRGVTKDGSNKVSNWADIGTNGKDASQAIAANQPTYIDDATSNINFNPVIEFENNGSTISQYLFNSNNGFYSQDIFIVMESDTDVTSSLGMTIFSGSIADILTPENYVDDVNDVTGIGLGNYTTNLTGERLWYNQGSSTTNPYYALPGSTSRTYSAASIINVGNKSSTVSDGMRILYNSVDDAVASTQTITTFENVGSIDSVPDPDVVLGTPYNIGKNKNASLGNLNGRIAEIFTFAERVSDADRQKIESYLGIKYGITLGTSTQAEKDYLNSFGTSVWDVSANAGYNYHVAGIGRDSISDLNQKQSKTINTANEVTIGLNGIFTKNSANTNEFKKDGDFLVWGSNNDTYTASGSNTITIATGITTSLTRILRQWKIVESIQPSSGGDVQNVYVSIPSAAFSAFTLNADEEYALIVANDDAFTNTDIIDVIPLKSDGNGNLQTWYDFDGTKYFTFGKVSKFSNSRAISIASGDYLVGEYALNLNINDFTISAWVKNNSTIANPRTIMSKGSKLQLRLNTSDQIEVMVDDDVNPRFTSSMQINDGKWHQITFVYNSGSIFLYVDGVLDKSEQNVVAPSPNYNRFAVGVLYIDKNNIINPFLGEIDEVYVWDKGLTEHQVRYLMNQEVEKGIGDFVTGKVLPQAAENNQITTISWSKLKAYYDFNSFYGSTVEGLTDARNFLRINYLNKGKSILTSQTIPAPYITISDGDWDTPGTWLNGSDNLLPNSAGLDGSVVNWNIAEIGHDVSSGDRDIELLGLIQTSGTLTIADPVVTFPVENNAGQALTITNYLELDGVIDLVGESQLIQTEGSIIDADSGGYIERDQQGTANGFNYNYWSSSVGTIAGNSLTRGTGASTTNVNYSIVDVINNGTDSENYVALNFDASPSGGTVPPPGLSRTVSSYWLYKFYGTGNDYYSWISIDEMSSLLPGEGFSMKGTSGSVSILTEQNYVFKGLPYNGDITLELNNTSEEVNRLIGNPYPSAIDAREFILDNLGIADGGNNVNGTVFNGALYFWDHFGEENTHNMSGYVGGYATRNLTGGAVAISNDSRINNTSDAGNPATGTKIPGEFIPVNQGFFVTTVLDGFDNDNDPASPITTVVGGDIVFKNSQRVYATEDGSTSMFLKFKKNKKTSSSNTNEDKKPIIRLMYDSPLGYHRQIVIGANDKATNGFNLGYDAFMADVNEEDMYWLIEKSKFVIQGVNNFDLGQAFPLGLKVNKRGIISVKLDELLNVDSNQQIYIKDTYTGETFNIKSRPFQTVLDPGSYHDRFYLVFQPSQNVLGLSEIELEHSCIAFYESQNSNLTIILKSDNEVTSGSIFNIMGQKMKSIKGFSDRTSMSLKLSSGTYIIQLHTIDGTINKKVIIN